MKPERIAKQLSKEIGSLKAVSLYGSIALGYNDRFTKDLDLAAFVDTIPPIKERKKSLSPIIKKWNKAYEAFQVVDVFDTEKLKDVSIWYVEINEVENWIKSFKRNMPPNNQLVDYVYKAKILYDPQNILSKWKGIMRKYPDELRRHEVSKLTAIFRLTRSDTIGKEIKRGNWNFLNNKLSWEFGTLLAAIYALNRKYWSSPKWAYRDLESFKVLPKGFMEKFQSFNKPDGVSFKEKVKILDQLAWETLHIARKEIPGLKILTKF